MAPRSLREALRYYVTAIKGSSGLESPLVRGVTAHYKAKNRLAWELSAEHPHFTNFRSMMVDFVFGDDPQSSFIFDRAAVARDVIPPGSCVLDIGCGDGFLTKRFYAERASHIDAIDVESDAITYARTKNANSRIAYFKLDAVTDDFPSKSYDAVIWNGAIGHFAKNDVSVVLTKVQASLNARGVFVGAESLGTTEAATDHLQIFPDEASIVMLMKSYFAQVITRVLSYKVGIDKNVQRHEVLWRCSINQDALMPDRWSVAE